MEIKLKNVPIAFPALAEPQAFGEGEPAYGARFPIEPGSEHQKLIEQAMLDAAKERWKDDAEKILKMLIDDGKVCFSKKVYKNKKGEPYQGFEGKHYLQTRSAKSQPTVLDRFAKKVENKRDIERLIYSGCNTNISVDVWAQDNTYGRRINATLRGVMWAGDGESWGGGSAPASEDEFAEWADDAGDLV